LVLLGTFTGFFVQPYKTPAMFLAEQLESLSALAHMMFIFFRCHRTSFCPGQLFYDVESMVKNTFWVVAKQKLLDDSLDFYITQTGEDRLEVNFGIYRLMDNSRNIDVLQLSSTAIEILRIFGAYPEWDRGHRCLRLDGVEGVDHTNPKSWTGDVRPSGVSLLTAWNAGRRKATQIFQE
ncbi:hypothetical protein L208DRAFT_1106993, partial [Tricholoma matsutake]